VENGRPVRIEYGENDHCCQRFALADEWLRGRALQAEGTVGYSHARTARARDIVALAVAELARDPLLFLHPADAGCVECDKARSTVE
jgi:aminoglycoside 3-N-acetyltransferase